MGGALVAALAKAGHTVIGLVHRNTDIRCNDGKVLGAELFDGFAASPGRIQVLRGDVRCAGLGLDPGTGAWLNRHIDIVIHCAALVRFTADANELEAVNLDGTRHVARLFSGTRLIHVSTAYVCGLRNGSVSETQCNPDGSFGNEYERSKAKAEAALHELRPDAIIVRPSIIVGAAATGRIQSFDTIYRAFKFIAEGRIRSVQVSPSATLNFVPIDYVVGGICDLVENAAAAPTIIHLTARKAVLAAHFLSLIGTLPGLHRPRLAPCSGPRTKEIGIAERVAQPYWDYFQRHPEFETGALQRLTGRMAPQMDDAALTRQIGFCVEAGFIRANRNIPSHKPA